MCPGVKRPGVNGLDAWHGQFRSKRNPTQACLAQDKAGVSGESIGPLIKRYENVGLFSFLFNRSAHSAGPGLFMQWWEDARV